MTRFNFHGCFGWSYTPITNVASHDGNREYARARPLYYGMLAFTEATSHESYLVQTRTSKSMQSGNVQAWSTVTSNHPKGTRLCVVLLQKNLTTLSAVSVEINAGPLFANATGQVTRIHAQDLFVNATWNILYGGLSFDNSTNGLPSGTRAYEPVTTGGTGGLVLSILPASITLIEIFVPRWR